jgi:hypothetical protein
MKSYGANRLRLHGGQKLETVSSSELIVSYQTKRRHIPKDLNPDNEARHLKSTWTYYLLQVFNWEDKMSFNNSVCILGSRVLGKNFIATVP